MFLSLILSRIFLLKFIWTLSIFCLSILFLKFSILPWQKKKQMRQIQQHINDCWGWMIMGLHYSLYMFKIFHNKRFLKVCIFLPSSNLVSKTSWLVSWFRWALGFVNRILFIGFLKQWSKIQFLFSLPFFSRQVLIAYSPISLQKSQLLFGRRDLKSSFTPLSPSIFSWNWEPLEI